MPSRAVLSRLLVLLALAAPAAVATGCGEDAASTSARVSPGADAPARTAAEEDAGAAASDAAEEAAEEAGQAAGEAAGGAPAGAQADAGQEPYEGDGDGNAADDADQPGAPRPPSPAPAPQASGADPGGVVAPATGSGGVEAAGGGSPGPGDEAGMAVAASFTLEDGSASPMRVEVPAFLTIALEVENAGSRAVQVRLRAPGAEAFTVGPGQTVTRSLPGVAPGLYPLEEDGGASGAVVVAVG
jgi:hypothetical protein